MSLLHVCMSDCTSGYKTKRFDIPFNKLNKQTDSLFSEISREISSSDNEFEVVYCGQKVDKGMEMSALNLTPQSTVFVFRKPAPAQSASDKCNLQMASEMMPLINKAVQRPSYKKTVDRIMTSPESFQKLVNAVPGLDKDPTSLSMLQDPELLQLLVHRTNIHKVLKLHPLFGAAAVYIAKIVNEEHSRDPARTARSDVYSLDRMSDEEDEGGAQAQQQRPSQVRPSQVPPPQITASQVAAALAAATASAAAAHASAPGPSGATPSTSGAQGTLFPDLMQQRMMTAQNTALEAQLQQLSDMGITDENMARQALSATNGDLQAALEIIFGDDGSN